MRLRIATSALLLAASAFAADPAMLAMLPQDPKMVAGVNFDRAKNSPFGQRILAEMKDEDKGFKEFVESTGFDPRRDLQEAVMASDGNGAQGDRSLVIARGAFDGAKLGAFFKNHGSTVSYYQGVELWSNPKEKDAEGAVAILNSSMALFGRTSVVKEAIDKRASTKSPFSADMERRVADWSSKNDAWFVSATGFGQLGVNKNGQNAVLPGNLSTDAIQQASSGVRFGSTVDISGEALARSDKDAQALADVMRFMASMIRLNAKPGMEDIVKIADSLQVNVSGSTATFSLSIPEDQLEKVLNKKPAAAKSATRRKSANPI